VNKVGTTSRVKKINKRNFRRGTGRCRLEKGRGVFFYTRSLYNKAKKKQRGATKERKKEGIFDVKGKSFYATRS